MMRATRTRHRVLRRVQQPTLPFTAVQLRLLRPTPHPQQSVHEEMWPGVGSATNWLLVAESFAKGTRAKPPAA